MTPALIVLGFLGLVYWVALGRPKLPRPSDNHQRHGSGSRLPKLGGVLAGGLLLGHVLHVFLVVLGGLLLLVVLVSAVVLARRRH